MYNLIRDLIALHAISYLFVGLVVPDVPLEETEILRKEAAKKSIELVHLFLAFLFSHSFLDLDSIELKICHVYVRRFNSNTFFLLLLLWFEGVAYDTYNSDRENESHCGSCRRIRIPGKFVVACEYISFKIKIVSPVFEKCVHCFEL